MEVLLPAADELVVLFDGLAGAPLAGQVDAVAGHDGSGRVEEELRSAIGVGEPTGFLQRVGKLGLAEAGRDGNGVQAS